VTSRRGSEWNHVNAFLAACPAEPCSINCSFFAAYRSATLPTASPSNPLTLAVHSRASWTAQGEISGAPSGQSNAKRSHAHALSFPSVSRSESQASCSFAGISLVRSSESACSCAHSRTDVFKGLWVVATIGGRSGTPRWPTEFFPLLFFLSFPFLFLFFLVGGEGGRLNVDQSSA